MTGIPGGRAVHDETFDAVLFDMDGTLVDSTASVVRSWTRWAEEFAVPRAALRATPMHGRPAADIVADLVPAGQVQRAYRRIVELEVSDTEGCVLLPGASAALVAVGDRGAIVTSCSTPLARARLSAAAVPVKPRARPRRPRG